MKYKKIYVPSQKQWQKVIDNLYSVLPMVLEGGFRIHEAYVCLINGNSEISHKCGTIHCVGGWYLIAHERDRVFKNELAAINRQDNTLYVRDYKEGADKLAMDLGFEFKLGITAKNWLTAWASENELWGNDYGFNMFVDMSAYENEYNSNPKTFEDIIHHFEYVKEQCRLYQKR